MKIENKIDKKNKVIDTLAFLVLLAGVSVITFTLFYNQTRGSEALYHSDMKAYILEMQGLDSGYSFPYPVFFKISAFFHLFVNPQLAVALATLLLNSGAMVIVKLALNYHVLEKMEEGFSKRKWLAGVIVSFVSVSLFFVSMLFPPEGIYLPGIKHNYLGVFTANPFHNATYMAARPFTILAYLWFAKLLDNYEMGYSGKWRTERHGRNGNVALRQQADGGVMDIGVQQGPAVCDYVLFALFLLLATMTKPSFTIVMVGAAGLIMVWRMVRSKFKNFWPTIQLGLCFIPTFIDLLYQFKGVFVPTEGEEGGIGFTFGKIWGLYTDNLPLAICLGVGFPLAVLVLNWKQLKTNTLFRFAWQIYLMGFAMAFFLYEKGFRWADFNFSWGYMCGIFFAFLGAMMVLLPATGQKKKPLWLALQWGPFLWHLACGIYYFIGIAQGQMYY